MRPYREFLQSKHLRVDFCGFDVEGQRLNRSLFDWQALVVRWWLKRGRAGGFEDCGLGKTLQQLAWAEAILLAGRGRRVLILAPPAVAQQTWREAEKFSIRVAVKVCKSQAEVDSGISITNYERLHKFEPKKFDAVVLDESSILKSYMGKTKQRLLTAFRDTPYRLACTATPAPNDHLEIGNHAEFLGIMRANEMLSRWFINDSMSAGNYRLKGHAESDFWRWLAAWAVSVSKPSDLGPYDDAGYVLPPLNLVEHCLGDECLLGEQPKISATALHAAKRQTADERAGCTSRIVAGLPASEPWVLWCDTNYEADALSAAIPDAVEIRGDQSLDEKEEKLEAFSAGQIKRLISKSSITGFGLNWQHCANTVFPLSYSYESFYQALHRFLRFGQTRTVNCHLVYTAAERTIYDSLKEKQAKHELMKDRMSHYMSGWQQENLHGRRQLAPPAPPQPASGPGWTLYLGDCVDVTKSLPDDSIDFCLHSPPFSNLYIYSDSLADMGNAKDHGEYFNHYRYLIEQIYRVTVPGRLCAVHCKDLPLYKGRDGAAGLFDFPGKVIAAFEASGWVFHSRVTIWKDPVTEMQRTKNHGLLHRQLCKDSCASRQGMADYLLVFRKWNDAAEFPKPVTLGTPFCRFTAYVGEEGPGDSCRPLPTEAERLRLSEADPYSIAVWQRYASPVWFDVNQMRVLNYRLGRDDKDEKHICPLQLDVIERAIELWTNPGDLVLDPFNGIGSTGYVALKTGRQYVGSELKKSYFDQSLINFDLAIKQRQRQEFEPQKTLFDGEADDFHAIAI
jgi:DNA modification methylase